MGRPLKQKFFDPIEGTVSIGGESVASLSFSDRGTGYFVANVAIAVGAPNLPTGVQATINSITLFGNGAINSYSITNAGTGYTTAPTVTITGANTTPAAATSTLTGTVTNVIATSAYVPVADGGSSAVAGDIVKQVGTRRFKVKTAQGTGKCKLVAAAPAAGEMTVTATDSLSSTYYVTKLTKNLALLTQLVDGGSGFEFETGTRAKWALEAAVTGTVQVSSN